MKNFVILFILLTITSITNAQNGKSTVVPDPRVVEVFGQETIDFYLQNKPSVIEYYNFFLDNSYTIQEIPQEKVGDLPNIPEMKLKEKYQTDFVDYSEKGLENLNIMKYDLKIDPNVGPIYRLGNTNKIIVFLSGKEIQSAYNKYVNENKK